MWNSKPKRIKLAKECQSKTKAAGVVIVTQVHEMMWGRAVVRVLGVRMKLLMDDDAICLGRGIGRESKLYTG